MNNEWIHLAFAIAASVTSGYILFRVSSDSRDRKTRDEVFEKRIRELEDWRIKKDALDGLKSRAAQAGEYQV